MHRTDMMAKSTSLAADAAVQGQIVDLGTYDPISQTYHLWDANLANPAQANIVAASIQSLLTVTLKLRIPTGNTW